MLPRCEACALLLPLPLLLLGMLPIDGPMGSIQGCDHAHACAISPPQSPLQQQHIGVPALDCPRLNACDAMLAVHGP